VQAAGAAQHAMLPQRAAPEYLLMRRARHAQHSARTRSPRARHAQRTARAQSVRDVATRALFFRRLCALRRCARRKDAIDASDARLRYAMSMLRRVDARCAPPVRCRAFIIQRRHDMPRHHAFSAMPMPPLFWPARYASAIFDAIADTPRLFAAAADFAAMP